MTLPTPPPGGPLVSLDVLSTILHEPARWMVFRELAKGEPLPVQELARRAGKSPAVMSKHMRMIRRAGLAVTGYGRLYRLAPGVRVDVEARVIDLGHCLLRLDTPF